MGRIRDLTGSYAGGLLSFVVEPAIMAMIIEKKGDHDHSLERVSEASAVDY